MSHLKIAAPMACSFLQRAVYRRWPSALSLRRFICQSSVCHEKVKDLFRDQHRKTNTRSVVPVFLQAKKHSQRRAVLDQHGTHMYEDILNNANNLADNILEILDCNKQISSKGLCSAISTMIIDHKVVFFSFCLSYLLNESFEQNVTI